MENIAFPFDICNGEIKTADYAESVKQSVKTILLTHKGERVMLPEFGTNIRGYLFEPINQTIREIIRTEVTNALYEWENRIRDIAVEVMDAESGSGLRIAVSYSVTGAGVDVRDNVQVIIGNA
jgi:phage baseplate assembly protein W